MCYKSVLIKNVIVQPSLCLGVLNRKNRYPPPKPREGYSTGFEKAYKNGYSQMKGFVL